MFSRIADIENKQEFLALLPASAIKFVASSLGELFKFDPCHPTGRYKLNLADTHQFMLAQKLQVVYAAVSFILVRMDLLSTVHWHGHALTTSLSTDAKQPRSQSALSVVAVRPVTKG
jgi:hypothetical protein